LIREQLHLFPISKKHLVHVLAGGCVCYSRSFALRRLERRPVSLSSLWQSREVCNHLFVGYQQNRVPHFYRKNHLPRQNYGPRPITTSPGLTLLKTKAKGQAPEPPQRSSASSDPSPFCPTLVTSSRRSIPLHSYCFARPPL
jgi:hypothetical protein